MSAPLVSQKPLKVLCLGFGEIVAGGFFQSIKDKIKKENRTEGDIEFHAIVENPEKNGRKEEYPHVKFHKSDEVVDEQVIVQRKLHSEFGNKPFDLVIFAVPTSQAASANQIVQDLKKGGLVTDETLVSSVMYDPKYNAELQRTYPNFATAMPNILAAIFCGDTVAHLKSSFVKPDDDMLDEFHRTARAQAEAKNKTIFETIFAARSAQGGANAVKWVDDVQKVYDIVPVTGSSPAYFFYLAQKISAASRQSSILSASRTGMDEKNVFERIKFFAEGDLYLSEYKAVNQYQGSLDEMINFALSKNLIDDFIISFAKAMQVWAIEKGFSEKEANDFIKKVMLGSAIKGIEDSEKSANDKKGAEGLVGEVATKGGATEKAIFVFAGQGAEGQDETLEELVSRAMDSCFTRKIITREEWSQEEKKRSDGLGHPSDRKKQKLEKKGGASSTSSSSSSSNPSSSTRCASASTTGKKTSQQFS